MAKREILNNDAVTLRVGEGAVDAVESVLDNAEKALDVIENKLDDIENQVERVVTVTKNNPILIAGALIVGLGIGGFVAYKLTQKRLTAQFDEELREQLSAAKEFHKRIKKEDEFESPESAVQALVPDSVVDAVQSYQGRGERVPYNKPEEIVDPRPPVDVVVEKVEVQQNVFVDARKDKDPRDWDINAEIADRELHPDLPYVISFDEFNENLEHYEQDSLTYYEQDDQLVDAQDKPVDQTDYLVGEDNLNRFGEGSGDPNVVYIRNEKIATDFEIVRSKGSYHKELFGTDPEPASLQHSRRRASGRRSWRTDE